MHAGQLRKLVIRPTLIDLGLYSMSAEKLLLGTAAVESRCGFFLSQYPKGPARGIFQMEGATHDDIVKHYLKYKKNLKKKVQAVVNGGSFDSGRLVYDLRYASVFCRLHYLRVPEKLPDGKDIYAMGAYWKKYYNTFLGKGEVDDFVSAWDNCASKR